ncbi:large subunit ribosomal protein L30 [Atopostipes suicloacalis DSM 15692]|uniref:50S ribosomal protein L30 n=1 Tax=Atopostipes suicloacalis DSM 15692 TaxID=1121025 RepID=A0A1M4W4R0_9LACT|nr:50S ribosomal protein L30 [Atopostipes suicloacalis]SHE76135.1 large subunit ribosomal protein L30 [Atopostipes suicloacalis DSM 15692]
MANLKVTLKKSLIGRPKKQHNIIKTLGLTKKINSSNVIPDTEITRNTIKRVEHLVEVEEISE